MNNTIEIARLPVNEMDNRTLEKYTNEIQEAVSVIDKFCNPKILRDQSIPKELLAEAHGLVFLTMYKFGFLLSGKGGKGFVIARTTNGWSSPSFISTGGLAFGMMAGGEIVNYMIILGSRSSVNAFTRNGQVQIGSELDLALGPIGRAASASVNVGRGGIAPNYSYSHCRGLYGGIGLSSGILVTRTTFNKKCYGENINVRDILSGAAHSPHSMALWNKLDEVLGISRNPSSSGSSSLNCHECSSLNPPEARECYQCNSLLVYTVGNHSGKRKTGKLVITGETSV